MSQPRLSARARHALREAHRVCPRGEHRFWGKRCEAHGPDRRISERLWDTWGDEAKWVTHPAFDPEPRWRRGDRVHQRKMVVRMLARQTK